MSSNTFFNILAVLGILYGIWRAIRKVQMATFLTKSPYNYVNYVKPRHYVLNWIGAITFFAGIYKLFVR